MIDVACAKATKKLIELWLHRNGVGASDDEVKIAQHAWLALNSPGRSEYRQSEFVRSLVAKDVRAFASMIATTCSFGDPRLHGWPVAPAKGAGQRGGS